MKKTGGIRLRSSKVHADKRRKKPRMPSQHFDMTAQELVERDEVTEVYEEQIREASTRRVKGRAAFAGGRKGVVLTPPKLKPWERAKSVVRVGDEIREVEIMYGKTIRVLNDTLSFMRERNASGSLRDIHAGSAPKLGFETYRAAFNRLLTGTGYGLVRRVGAVTSKNALYELTELGRVQDVTKQFLTEAAAGVVKVPSPVAGPVVGAEPVNYALELMRPEEIVAALLKLPAREFLEVRRKINEL